MTQMTQTFTDQRRRASWLLVLSAALFLPATTMAQKNDTSDLQAKAARFAPTVITADAARLSKNDHAALDKIIAAARLLDELYIHQAWSGNPALEKRLAADTSPAGRARYHYFMINKGPWSQLDENHAFVEGVPETHPPQSAYYPDDMTKEEFEAW